MNQEKFTIAIDTREQMPYEFQGAARVALPSGDYSIVGLEDRVAVERKTMADAYGSVGQGRARFEREFERLSKMDYAAVVIECDIKTFMKRPPFTQMRSTSAIHTFVSWAVRYGVHPWFAGDRAHGGALTRAILRHYWRHRVEGSGRN